LFQGVGLSVIDLAALFSWSEGEKGGGVGYALPTTIPRLLRSPLLCIIVRR
jgi:hypothetical protein